MRDATDALVLDLVEWVAQMPRPYAEVLDAWRTSCRRLTVWEDAVDRGYVTRAPVPGRGTMVTATAAGLQFLRENGRPTSAAFAATAGA